MPRTQLRMGDIPESCVYRPHARRTMGILQDRMNHIKTRTQIANRQHCILDKYDYKMTDSGSSDPTGEKCQDYLDGLNLESGDMRRMAMHAQDIRHINEQIAILEGMIAKEALENEDDKLIMSMTGFEAFSALLAATDINGIERLSSPWWCRSWDCVPEYTNRATLPYTAA